MRIISNAGIGDIILLHAMLERLGQPATIGLSEAAVTQARSEAYRPFAQKLMETLFFAPQYTLDWSLKDGGIDPPTLHFRYGLPVGAPDLRDVLPAGEPVASAGYVVVHTKCRGWAKARYLGIKDRLLSSIRRIAESRLIVLLGERRIGMNAEYRHHGPDFVFSIYEDLCDIPCLDLTVPELGITPPDWTTFRQECLVMRDAAAVVALGSSGNTTMAQACGCWIGCIGGSEMEAYLRQMPEDPRHRICREPEEFLAAVEVLA